MATPADMDLGLQWLEMPRAGRVAPALPLPSPREPPARKRKRSPGSLSDASSVLGGSSVDEAAVDVHLTLPSLAAKGRASGASRPGRGAGRERAGPPEDTTETPAEELNDALKRVYGRYYSASRESTARCYRCKEVGHYAMFCKGAPKNTACWICGDTGHQNRDCNADSCFICDEPGHRWGECPNRRVMEDEVLRLGHVPGYGRHLVMQLGPEDAATRLMPRRAIVEGRARAFLQGRDALPAAQVLTQHFCALCASERHGTSACPHAARDLAQSTCCTCGARGHAYCTGGARRDGGQVGADLIAEPREFKTGTCFNCGGGGHEGPACPKVRSHVQFDGTIGPRPAEEYGGGGLYGGGAPASKRGRSEQYDGVAPPSRYDGGGSDRRLRPGGRYGYDSGSEEEEEEEEEEEDSSSGDEAEEVERETRADTGSRRVCGEGGSSFAGTCFKCGAYGHRAVDCAGQAGGRQGGAGSGRPAQYVAPTNVGGAYRSTSILPTPGPFQSTFKVGVAAPVVKFKAQPKPAKPAFAPPPLPAKAAAPPPPPQPALRAEPVSPDDARDPWWQRDPIADKERKRILSSAVSDTDKKLFLAKLRKTVKRNEKKGR